MMLTFYRIAFSLALASSVSIAYGYKPTFYNNSKRNELQVKMQLSGADEKVAILQPGQSISFEIGGWCVSTIVLEVTKGPLQGTVITDYLPQKDAYPFAGLRCGSFNIYIEEEFDTANGMMRLMIQDDPNGGFRKATQWKNVGTINP